MSGLVGSKIFTENNIQQVKTHLPEPVHSEFKVQICTNQPYSTRSTLLV